MTPPSPNTAAAWSGAIEGLRLAAIAIGWSSSEAAAEYRTALAIWEKLAEDNPSVPGYRDSAANVDNNLSMVLRPPGPPGPRPATTPSGPWPHASCSSKPTPTADYRARPGRKPSQPQPVPPPRACGKFAGHCGRRAGGNCAWEGLPSRGEEWFATACARAALAGLARRAGSGVSADEAASEADAAMALLGGGVAMGHRSHDAYRTEDALDPLRERDDFRLLMMDLAMPADPFAATR